MHTLPASSACFTSKNTSFASSASALQPPWTSASTPFKAAAIFFWISLIFMVALMGSVVINFFLGRYGVS